MLTKEKDQDTDPPNEVRGEKTGDVPTEPGNERQTDGPGSLSFLGARPTIPPLPDSPEPFNLPKPEEHQLVAEIPFGIKDSPADGVEQDPLPPQVNSGPNCSPAVNASPTAIPFADYYRKPPLSSAGFRFRPPLQSGTRTRPRSTEFKSSEFRPLYLVARHTPRQELSIEGCYSLPSSHSTSRTSSIQDPEEYDFERGPNQIDALDLVDRTTMNPHREGRGFLIDTQHSLQSSDLLDSAQSTPTAHSFQAASQRDASPQAKAMKDPESAFVAMPLLPSPSLTNSKHDPSYTSQYRSQELIRDRTCFSSDHDWKNSLPEYPFKLTEDLPPLPNSRASSPDSVSEPHSLETIFQPIIRSKYEFELPDDLPPLPSSRAPSPDLDDELDEPNKNPQPSLHSTENKFERLKEFSDLSSSRPFSPDPYTKHAEQRLLSPSKHVFDIPEDLPSLPSSRVSSPELREKMKSTPQSAPDVGIPGDLLSLPISRTPTPDLDAELGQSISLPQLIRGFDSPRNLPALPSSRALSPDNDFNSPPESKSITRPVYSFQAPEDLPTLPSSRASSPGPDAEFRNRVSIRQPVNEFEQSEDPPALPSSRFSSPAVDAESNLEIERGISPQPLYGLERSENLQLLPSTRASSPDFDIDFNAEPIISPQSTFGSQRSEGLPGLPSSRASSPDFDADYNVEPTISPQSPFEFQQPEDLPGLPSSRASSPAADAKSNLELERKKYPQPIYGLERSENLPPLPSSRASSPEIDTAFNVEPTISPQSTFESQRSEDLPAPPSGRALSPDADIFHDVETRKHLEPTLEFPSSENLPALPSSRASSPDADVFHDIENKLPLEPMLESYGFDDLPALPVSRAPSLEGYIAHDSKTKISLEPKLEFQRSQHLPRLSSSRSPSPDSDIYHDVENKIHLQPANLIQRLESLPPLPPSRSSSPNSSNETEQFNDKWPPKIITPGEIIPNLGSGLSIDEVAAATNAEIAGDAKNPEPSFQRQPDVENADPLSTLEKGVDIEPTLRLQESLSSGTLVKGLTGDEVVAVMAAVAEGGANTHEKRPTTNSKKARRNQKKAKQGVRPQASEASNRASIHQQEGMEDQLSPQSFASKGPNMLSDENLVDATDLFIPTPSTELSRRENIQIEENAPLVKKGKGGKKNKNQAVQSGPSPKSVVNDGFSTKPGPQATYAAVFTHTAGDFGMEGAHLGGPSFEIVDQKSPKAAPQSETPPEAVALPIDDDLELLLPRSPSVRPIDRSLLLDSFPETTVSSIDDHQGTVLKAGGSPEAVKSTSDTDSILLDPTHYDETTDGGRYQLKQPEKNEAREPFAMLAGLHNSALDPDIVPESVELTASDDLDLVKTSPQSPLVRKADETSQGQGQVKESLPELFNSPITESHKPDSEPNIDAQSIALPPNDDLDLLETSPPTPSTVLTHTEWLEQPEPLVNESPESILAHEISPRAGPLPDDEDLSLPKASSRSPSIRSTEQRSYRPEFGEFDSSEEIESFTQLSKKTPVLAPEFIALPSDIDTDLLEPLPQMPPMPPVEVPQLNAQLDESKSDTKASSPRSPEMPIIQAEDITPTADYNFDDVGKNLPIPPNESIEYSSPAEEPTAKLSKDVCEIQSCPETVALPVDDDLDLLEALPPSPPTDPQLELTDEPSLRSPTETFTPNTAPDIFVSPVAKGFRSPSSLATSSFAGQMPTIPEEVLEEEDSPESFRLPSDDDLDLVEEVPASPLADPMDSQLETLEEPKFHASRELNENEVTPLLIPDKELDLPGALSPSPLSEGTGESPKETTEAEVNPETIRLPDNEDLDLLMETLPPSPSSDTSQVPQVGSITLPATLPSSSPTEQISRSPKGFLELNVSPGNSEIPADEELGSRRAIPPSSPFDPPLNPVKEQIFRLPEEFLASEVSSEPIILPADKDFDLLEALPPNIWAGSQQSSGKEASSRSLTNIPGAKTVTQETRDYHDLEEVLPPSASEKRIADQPKQHEELHSQSLKELSEIEVTPQSVELPYDDDLDLLEELPPSPLASPILELKSTVGPPSPSTAPKENHVEQLEERITKSPEPERITPQSPLSPSIVWKDYHAEPAEEIVSKSLELKVKVNDDLDSFNTPPPSTKLTEHQTRLLEEPIPVSQAVAPSAVACADGEHGLLEPRPDIFSADHQTGSMEEPIPISPEKAPSTVVCADSDSALLEPRPEIFPTDHQTGPLEDPIPKLLELAPSTVACADGDLGVPDARPEILSVNQSSQQTDLLDERISKWQNELVAESRLPPESIPLPADGDSDVLATMPPSPTKSIVPGGVELRPLEKTSQPEEASPYALEPLKEIDSQVFPQGLSPSADDALDLLEASTESPLPEPQAVPNDVPLPTDDDLDLLEALPESPLSESQVAPEDSPLATDIDFELLEALPESPLPESQVVPKDFPIPVDDELDLLEALPESRSSESQVIPEDLPLPTDNGLDLFKAPPKSSLPESQVVPKDLPLPTDDDLDLLEELPESPLSESRVVREDLRLPKDNDLNLLEAPRKSSLPGSQVVPKDFPLPTDDDLDLLDALPESPPFQSSNTDSDELETQHLEAKEHAFHNPIIPSYSETEVAPENLQLPTSDDLDLEAPPQSPLARPIDPETKDIASPEMEDTPKGEVAEEFEEATDNAKEDTYKVNEDMGKDAHILAALGRDETCLGTAEIILEDVVNTGPSVGKNAKKNKKAKKDKKSAITPILPPIESATRPLSIASEGQLIEDIASEPKEDTSATELEEGKDGVVRQFVVEADEEPGSGKDKGKRGEKPKSGALSVEASTPTTLIPSEVPTKSIGGAVSEVLMQDKTKKLTSEESKILDNDGGFSKKGTKRRRKGKKNQEESSNSGLILEEVEPPKASVAALPLEDSNETTETSESLMRNAEAEESQEQNAIEDQWLKEPEGKAKKGKKAEENSPPLESSTKATEPPSSETMTRDIDFEDSQAQAVTEEERLKEPKQKGRTGKKSKDKKSKPSIATTSLPPITSAASPIDDISSTDAAQVKAFELSLDHPTDTKDEISSEDKTDEAGMKQIPSSEDTGTAEFQPGQPESEKIVSEVALQNPQVEHELPGGNKKGRQEKKRKSKLTDTYGEESGSEKDEFSHAPYQPRSELVDQLIETRGKESVEERRQDQGLTETVVLELEQIEQRQKIREEGLPVATIDDEPAEPVRNGNKGKKGMNSKLGSEDDTTTLAEVTRNELEPTQVMPELESELRIPDEVKPQESDDQPIGAQPIGTQQIEPENLAHDISLAKSMEPGKVEPDHADLEEPQPAQSHLADIKDLASGQPKSQLMEENPTEISLKVEPEAIEEENLTFNAASPPAQQIGGSAPTPQDADYTEPISEDVAATIDNTKRKTPSNIVDSKDLQAVEHSPTPEKDLATTNPSIDQQPSVLESSAFPATESSFTELSEKSSFTAEQPSVRENNSVAETPSSEKPSVAISSPAALRPLPSDTYLLPVEELSVIGSSDKTLVPLEVPVDIEPLLSGISLIVDEEVPVIDVPSVDESPATAKELAPFEPHHSPDHVKEPQIKDLDVSPADKSLIGFEEPPVRDMVSSDKYLPAADDPSVLEFLSPEKAPVTLEEPAVIAPSSNKSLVHVEQPSATESGPPEKSAIPVQEPPATESPASGKSPLTIEEFSAITAEEPPILDASSSAPKKREDEPGQLDVEPTEKAKKDKKGKKGSKVQKEGVDRPEKREDDSILSEKQDQVEGPISADRVTPFNLSAVPVIQGDRLEESPIATNPTSPEDLSSIVPDSHVDELEQLQDDPIAPDYSSIVKNTKKGKQRKSGRQRLNALPEEVPVTPEDTSATGLKQTDQLDRPEEDPVISENISENLSALHTKQTDQLDQPEESPFISRDLSAHTKQFDPLDQVDDPNISEDLSALIVDMPIQTQEDPIPSEELSAKILDENIEDPVISEYLTTNSKSKKGKNGKKVRKHGVHELDQLEDIDTTLARQADELDQPKESIAAKDYDPAFSNQLEPILSEGISTVTTTEKGEKGKIAKKLDNRGLAGPEDESTASDYSTAVIEAIQPEEPAATEKEGDRAIQPETQEFDRIDEEPIPIKSPAVPKKKKSKRGKKTKQEDIDSTKHPPIVSEDTFPPLEDYELDQPGQEAIASADVVAAPKAKKSKKDWEKKHVDRLGPTFLAPEDASASQDELPDRPDQSTIATEESATPEEQFVEQYVEIPLKNKGEKSKQYKNFDRLAKEALTPEETIASLENIPDVPISKEVGQDGESIQTSLAPVASGDTDTPQEHISAIPKNMGGKKGRKSKQANATDQSDAAARVASGNSLTLQDDSPNSQEEAKQDAGLDQTELKPLSLRDLPLPLVSKNETQEHERNEPSPEPSDKASALQEDFPEITIAKRNKRGKEGSQMYTRAIPEETIVTAVDAGGSELLPDDTRDLALEPISQELSEAISEPQAEPQHEETKEVEAGHPKSWRIETPVAEDSHMDNSLDVSLGVQAKEATLQDHLAKPQAEREFEDAGIRGEDNSLLIEGYREATQSEPSHEHPREQREQLAEAVHDLPTPASLDSMPSDVPIRLQSQSPLRELADRDVEHTYPTEILTSYDANLFVEPEKDDERLIPETSQTLHPSDGIILPSTPSLVTDSVEPQESKGLAEVEPPKSPGLTVMSSDIDFNRPTYLESLTEPKKYVPELPPIEPALEKLTPVEELSAPEWGLNPIKKSKKEKKSKKKALDRDSSSTGESLERGSAGISEAATVAGDLELKSTEGLEAALPEISLTEPDVEKSTHVKEPILSERGLTPSRKSKKEKKSKKKALDSDILSTREILEPGSADISEGATLAGDLDLKLTKKLEEDLPESTLAEADVEKSTPVEELSVPEWGLTARKSRKEKKSKKKALDSVSSSTREVLDEVPVIDDSNRPESGFRLPRKSKNDKKSKDRATASGSLIPEASELLMETPQEQSLPESLNADESISIEDSKISESRPLPSERSKKDKKSKNKPVVNNFLVTEENLESKTSEMPAEFSEEQILPELSSTKKSRKGKKAEKQNLEIDRGPSSAIGDNVERGPGEKPLDIPAEPTIPEHEPSTKRKKNKQSKKEDFELGVNMPPLDTELVPQNSQQAAEANRSAGPTDNLDNEEDSRSIDPTQRETERHQTLMPKLEISLDERELIQDSPPVDPHDEIGADNTNLKMASFIISEAPTPEVPTPEGSTPGESTPAESTPAESIIRDSVVPLSDSPHISGILPVQHDSRDTEARALETQYPELDQEESQPHVEGGEHSSGREIEAQELSRKPTDSATENTFNISVEVDPSYGVSISTPSSKRKRSLTVSAPARNDEEIFPDSTRGVESLQTEEQIFQDQGEPSPVSPTTKERSSALFQSSPSTREEFINRRPEPGSPLHDPAEIQDAEYGSRDLPDWTQPANFSVNERRTTAPTQIDLKTSNMNEKRGPSDSRSPVSPVSPISPTGLREERSPSRSPFVSDISDRSRLNTIVEYSPEESPLHKKSRSVPDVGSPEQGVRFRRRSALPQQTSQARMRSPLNLENTARLTGPFDDLTYRLSWPPVDEDNHTVDLERSGSRNTSMSKQSERRSPSGASVGSVESINAIIKTPDVKSSGTPPLRRTDRSVSGDLREAHKKGGAKKLAKRKEAERQVDIAIPSSSTYDPTKDKGKSRVDDMAAVYVSIKFHFRIIYQKHRKLMRSQEGWGDVRMASPISPTRPHSMRRRQSLLVLDLENKIDQLVSENRLLMDAKLTADTKLRSLELIENDRSQLHQKLSAAERARDEYLARKDGELNELKKIIEGLHSEVSHLTEVNGELTASRGALVQGHQQRFSKLETEREHILQQWEQSVRELQELRQKHAQLSKGMEQVVQREVGVAVEVNNVELHKLRDELEAAKEQVRVLQQQILASKSRDDPIIEHDEDYFENQCQQLCGHVQQWVLRFSKFSDSRACYLASEVMEEKIVDRFENAILDGSDVDLYLKDRVMRRDVFMSVVMAMLWDFIFTRYLFGMDREQRLTLKQLERTLAEVGPAAAVNKWRATTLTLLSKREFFAAQRATDTEAILAEIFSTLATFLPPPSHLVKQVKDSLRKVLSAAVDLSIEMRTQRAQYMMLPPLQPEYDTHGELVQKVYFKSAIMNERSGMTISNEALEAQSAVVRLVLFPLIVKKGDDDGVGGDEVVICPAQVLIAKPLKDKKVVRIASGAKGSGGKASESRSRLGSVDTAAGGSDVGMGGMI